MIQDLTLFCQLRRILEIAQADMRVAISNKVLRFEKLISKKQ